MARSWCGFDAQNEGLKEQWGALEASRDEILGWLEATQAEDDAEGDPEGDVIYIPE